MAEFHNTKRIAIINKAGSGKSTLARYLIESEIMSEEGYWINTLWTNGIIYSGNLLKGTVDIKLSDGRIVELDKEHADEVVLSKQGEKIWYPKRYKSSDRPNGVELRTVSSMRDLPVHEAKRGEEIKDLGIIYLDEMFKCLPARRSGSQYNLVYGGMMANIRHIQCHFLGTDQVRKGVDNFIRGNIDIVLQPIAPLPDGINPLEYWEYSGFHDSNFDFLRNPPNAMENALLNTHFGPYKIPAKHIWNLYTTVDIPPLLYDEPFGVETVSNELREWRLPSGEFFDEKLREWTIRSPELRSYIILYEELEKKRMTENQRRALIAYLDTMGLLKKWEPKFNKKEK